MKIVCLIGSLGGGGAERVMAWLVNNLHNSGHDVTLVTQNSETPDAYACNSIIRRVRFTKKRYFNSSLISRYINTFKWLTLIRKTVIHQKPDVVLSFIDSVNVQCLIALIGLNVGVVVSERTDPGKSLISRKKKAILPFLYRRYAKSVVFQTSVLEKKYAEKWKLSNSLVIPNPVQSQFVSSKNNVESNIILSVGRLDLQKGHDILINAWAKIAHQAPGWALRIVGDGPEKENYKKIIHELGVSGSVKLVGFKSDIVSEYNNSSIFVLPSRVEGFPNVLIEAMASEMPIIASSSPVACKEIIQHGKTGVLFNLDSVNELANNLLLLIHDKKFRSDLGLNAVHVRDLYSENAVFDLWQKCLIKASVN